MKIMVILNILKMVSSHFLYDSSEEDGDVLFHIDGGGVVYIEAVQR